MPLNEPRPLIASNDPDLLDELLRLTEAAGVEPEVVPDPVAARGPWLSAPVIVVGADVLTEHARARPPKRQGVIVAGLPPHGLPDSDESWRHAVELGAEHVVVLPLAQQWLINRFTESTVTQGASANVISVIGGRGGAGSSVLTAALAVTSARSGNNSLLLDADSMGGGADLLLGQETAPGLRWPDVLDEPQLLVPAELMSSLPRLGTAHVLSWDRGSPRALDVETFQTVLSTAENAVDVIAIDLPRWPDDLVRHAVAASGLVLLVVPAEIRACAAASRVVGAIRDHCAELRCVIRGPAPPGLRPRDLARALDLPLAGYLRPEPGLAAALERGIAPANHTRGPLAEFCRQLLTSRSRQERAA